MVVPSDASPSPLTLCPQMGTGGGPDIFSPPGIQASASGGIHRSCTKATVSELAWDGEEEGPSLGPT
jgi:hypothetical protein